MSEQKTNTIGDDVVHSAHDGMPLLDMMIVLARHKKLVVGLPLLCAALAFAGSFLLTPVYVSTAKILPPQQQSSGVAALLGQLGGLAGAAGGLAGIKNSSDLYVGMLSSRTIADNLITRFQLKNRYEQSTMDQTRKALVANTELSSGKKDGLITISVSDENPQFAANLANAYVEELARLTEKLSLTDASQRRVFFEGQLKLAKDQLATAEVALRTTQEKTGMIQPAAQVQAIITYAAQLKGTIAAKEVQLKAMRTFAADGNPEMVRALEELRGLRGQLEKLENKEGAKDGNFMVPTGNIPEVGVEYVRRARDVKYYETIFELLAKQYELAKIDEAQDAPTIQLLDKAVAAERKTKPKRLTLLVVGGLIGAMLGAFIAFSLEKYRRVRSDPAGRQRLDLLAGAWRRVKRPSAISS